MKKRALELFTLARDETLNQEEVAQRLRLSDSRTSELITYLTRQGYLERRADDRLVIPKTPKALFLKRLSWRFNIATLFGEKRDRILLANAHANAKTIKALEEYTELSYSTLSRGLKVLTNAGVITEKNERYSLIDDQDLNLLLRILGEEETATKIEEYSELLLRTPRNMIKRTPQGRIARGNLTAFSKFYQFGMDYQTPLQYYIEPTREVSMEEALIHALAASRTKTEITLCMVFYTLNEARLNLRKTRTLAKEFTIQNLWLDVENFMTDNAIKERENFPTWEQFAKKAELYRVSPASFEPPKPFPDLFKRLGENPRPPMELAVFGGENMRMKGVKEMTHEISLLLPKDGKNMKDLEDGLKEIGFSPLHSEHYTPTEKSLGVKRIYTCEGHPRLYLFTETVSGRYRLTERSISRSTVRTFGNLTLYILSNEDIFFLKAITNLPGDVSDMRLLSTTPNFNWELVFDTMIKEEETTHMHQCRSLLDALELLQEHYDLRAPFYKRLLNHTLDSEILSAISTGKDTPLSIRNSLQHFHPEYKILNRLKSLIKRGKLVKTTRNGETIYAPKKSETPIKPGPLPESDGEV